MNAVEIKPNVKVTLDEILQAVSKLGAQDLERLTRRLKALVEKKQAATAAEKEAELLAKINRAYPAELNARYAVLSDKQADDTLEAAEHEELVALCDRFEELDAARLDALMELARLREVSLETLLRQLHLNPPALAYA